MAMTLFEASKQSDANIKRSAIIEMFARDSDILRALAFENITGGSYSYDVESALPGVGFRGLNEGYQDSIGVINPTVEVLRIVGGDLDVDRALIRTHGPEIRSRQERMKVKALSLYFTDRIINGDSSADARQFDGLRVRVAGPQLFAATGVPGVNGPLSLEALDAAIDTVDSANAIVVNKAMRRKIRKAARKNLGGDITGTKDQFGFTIDAYNDLPMLIAEYNHLGQRIVDFNEAGPAGGTTSTSVYVAAFGDGYILGLQNGGMEVEDLGQLESKPVLRTRLEWIVGMAVLHPRAIARIWGITNADVTE